MRTTVKAGTVGWGTTLICRANRSHRKRPKAIPRGTPTMVPVATAMLDCQATTDRILASGKPEGLEESQVAPATAHRSEQRQSQGYQRPYSEGGTEQRRGGPHGRVVVDDLGRALRGCNDPAVARRDESLKRAQRRQ